MTVEHIEIPHIEIPREEKSKEHIFNVLASYKHEPSLPEDATISEYVDLLMRENQFATMDDTGEIYRYEPSKGVYVYDGRQFIESQLETISPGITTHDVNEVLGKIRRRTGRDRTTWDANPDIRNLSNCLFNVATGTASDHTPDYLSLIQLPVKYDRRATCRAIIEALYNTFQDPTDVPLFLEYLAYVLFWDNKNLQKELLLPGEPDSGKSRILDTIIELVGKENTSNVTLQQLSTNRFAKAQLFGKLVNVYADISHTRIEDLENFKAIATADAIEAEKKGMQLFSFRPKAKQIYSANIPPRPPITVDDSFYRRFLIIQCAWRDSDYFTGKRRVRDPDIMKVLATEENLAGLLNLVIISARRLVEKKRFCKSLATDRIRELYDRLSNPVQMWVDSCCEEDEEGIIIKDHGYGSYLKFCKARKIGATTKEWLGKELSKLGYLDGKKGTGKEQVKVWFGLRLRDLGTGNASFAARENENIIVVQGKDPLPIPNSMEVVVN